MIIDKTNYPKLFLSRKLLDESKTTGTRIPKYMALFKSYEALTQPNERNITFTSTRHSFSHATLQLTRPEVIKNLNELYVGLDIDLSKFKHKKSFYISLWNLFMKTDELLSIKIIEVSKQFEYLYPDLKFVK